MAGTIMIVEDEPAVARGVQVALEREGYATAIVGTGEEAVKRFADIAPDLVLLDVRLPGIDGFEVLRQLRRETRAPVLFLTARADEVDKVVGLEIGADDYLVKPFSPRELVARVKALLRRPRSGASAPVGDLAVDPARRTATVRGAAVTLTATEFDILAILARDPGVVVTRADLLNAVWGPTFVGDDHLVDVHVANLRGKIGEGFVETVRGVGYKLADG
jgi:DNA-binding response OmpR family regulator